jgi:uncharacterized small protein (DUF1192 family)
MKNTHGRSILAIAGLLALAPLSARAQYEPQRDSGYDTHYAPPRMLVALEDDLRILDDDMRILPARSPRYQEFQRRADDIGRDVTDLADRMRGHSEGRHDAPMTGATEVSDLRQRIAVLRDDIENTRARRGSSFLVPAGTQIELFLDRELSSRSSNIEDQVEASTTTAIRLNGRTLIPAGATVSGVVREVRSRSRGQKDGWIRLDFDTLTLENGVRMNIRSHVVSVSATHSDGHDARNAGLGAILGGVLGGIIHGKEGFVIGAVVGAGGGLLASQGDDVELPGGSLVTIRLDAPLNFGRR